MHLIKNNLSIIYLLIINYRILQSITYAHIEGTMEFLKVKAND